MNIEELEAKLSRRPNSPLFARLADEYLAVGRINEAKELCSAGLQHFSDYATAYIVLAKCFEAEQNYTSAIQSIEQALYVLPHASLPLSLLSDYQGRLLRKPVVLADEDEKSEPQSAEITDGVDADLDIVTDDLDLRPELEQAEFTEESPLVGQYDEIDDASVSDILEPNDTGDVVAKRDALDSSDFSPRHGVAPDDAANEELSAAPEMSRNASGDPAPDLADVDEYRRGADRAAAATTEDDGKSERAQAVEFASTSPSEPLQELETKQHGAELEDNSRPPSDEGNVGAEILQEKGAHGLRDDQVAFVDANAVPEAANGGGPSVPGNEGRIVSRTLAEIYARQGAWGEAIITYRLLLLERPESSDQWEERIRELEAKVHNGTPT